jgi:Protein of unknown function (DUF3108)
MRALVFALVLFSFASPAAADRYLLRFEGAGLGFVPLGRITLEADVASDTYEVEATLESRGLLNLFEPTNLRANASGLISGESVHWRRYQLDHHYSRKHRAVTMSVGDSGELATEIVPNYRLWGDPPASEEQRRRSRDPLSSLMAMAVDVGQTQRCAGAYPTFDGRFHYLLELAGGELDRFDSGGFEGRVLKCALAYIAVSGFERRDAGRRRIPHGEVWFALAENARFAPPVRIQTPLSAGGAVVRLTSWRRVVVQIEDAPMTEP